MSRHESEEASPDLGAVTPVDPSPDTGARKTQGGQQKRHRRFCPATHETGAGAIPECRSAGPATPPREHRALYTADARLFRRIVRAARSTVFWQKPGLKPDRQAARRIAPAAGRRGRGAKWPVLYQEYIPSYQDLNVVTRAYAEDGFRRRVNKYLQSHKRLREPE